MRQDIMTDFGYRYVVITVVFSWLKRLHYSKVMWFYLYPLIHITDDYLSKNVIGLIFCEITNSHFYNTVSVSRYLVKNIVIFTHFITLAAPTPWKVQQVFSHNLQEQLLWILIEMKLHYCGRFFLYCPGLLCILITVIFHFYVNVQITIGLMVIASRTGTTPPYLLIAYCFRWSDVCLKMLPPHFQKDVRNNSRWNLKIINNKSCFCTVLHLFGAW